MPDPLFSILIPTRDRTDVLASCLKAALNQRRAGNFEVIVLDNAGPPECGELVRSVGDSRVSHLRSEELLSMSENWERGIGAAQGDYLFYCGDDDALLADATWIAERICREKPGIPIAWQQAIYHWNTIPIESLRNRVLLPGKKGGRWICLVDSEPVVADFYAFRSTYRALPGVYNSFVPRTTLDRTVEKFGCYFASPIPDVWSGLATCAEASQFIYSNRPLSVGGVSSHSTGFSQNFRHLHGQSTRKFEEENKSSWKEPLDSRLENPLGATGDLYICDTMLKARDRLFDEPRPELSFSRLVEMLIGGINRYVDHYDEAVAMIRIIAERNGVELADDAIPALEDLAASGPGRRIPGFRRDAGEGGLRLFPDPAIVRDVYDAATYVATLITPGQDVVDTVLKREGLATEPTESLSDY